MGDTRAENTCQGRDARVGVRNLKASVADRRNRRRDQIGRADCLDATLPMHHLFYLHPESRDVPRKSIKQEKNIEG